MYHTLGVYHKACFEVFRRALGFQSRADHTDHSYVKALMTKSESIETTTRKRRFFLRGVFLFSSLLVFLRTFPLSFSLPGRSIDPGSPSPPPHTYGRCLHFYCGTIPAISSLVDSHHIVPTCTCRRSQQLLIPFTLYFFSEIISPDVHAVCGFFHVKLIIPPVCTQHDQCLW